MVFKFLRLRGLVRVTLIKNVHKINLIRDRAKLKYYTTVTMRKWHQTKYQRTLSTAKCTELCILEVFFVILNPKKVRLLMIYNLQGKIKVIEIYLILWC